MTDKSRLLIYAFVILAISIPMLLGVSVKPAELNSANNLFEKLHSLEMDEGEIVFLALDFGPNSKAENEAQAEVIIEHLMRRRIPFALFSIYQLAEPFLRLIPERVAKKLEAESPEERYEYGIDWVNLGYRPGSVFLIRSIPKVDDLVSLFGKDARGSRLEDIPAFQNVKTLEQIKMLIEFTGLVGAFDVYVQFFQSATYRPDFGHGCTSITIPEAYIYLDSGQIFGLLEGIAGAAWYEELLNKAFPGRKSGSAPLVNTGLGIAHLVIIFFILLGNILWFLRRRGGVA